MEAPAVGSRVLPATVVCYSKVFIILQDHSQQCKQSSPEIKPALHISTTNSYEAIKLTQNQGRKGLNPGTSPAVYLRVCLNPLTTSFSVSLSRKYTGIPSTGSPEAWEVWMIIICTQCLRKFTSLHK